MQPFKVSVEGTRPFCVMAEKQEDVSEWTTKNLYGSKIRAMKETEFKKWRGPCLYLDDLRKEPRSRHVR
jgi:hypothetical protein